MILLYEQGKYKEAALAFEEKAKDREDTGDELMWRMEEGAIFFAVGNYKKSIKAFTRAEKILEDYDKRADYNARRGGAEAGSVLTNANALPYKGNYFEAILLDAYKALDYFAIGDSEGARVELRKMYYNQRKVIDLHQKEINETQQAADKKKYNQKQVMGRVRGFNKIQNSLKDYKNKTYGNYAVPFATYLSAIGYLTDKDYDGATVDFRNLYRMSPDNPQIQRDYVTCARQSGQDVPDELEKVQPADYPLVSNIVFVIVANGRIAARKGITIHLVLPPPVTGYSGVAFPIIEYFAPPCKFVEIEYGKDKSAKTVPIADMDQIVTQNYKDELPAMIMRLFISVAAKETANFFALQAAKTQGDAAYWGTVIATSTYKYIFNTPDTRCWQLLPKEYQVTNFPKPPDNHIKVNINGDGWRKTQDICLDPKKKMAILYVMTPVKNRAVVKVFEFN